MMRLGKRLLPLFLAASCSGGVRARATIVDHDDAPPALREESVVYRPGFVWIHGRWDRDHRQWAWKPGYYERERPGYVYIEGRWAPTGRNYVWIDGGWRRHEGVATREPR